MLNCAINIMARSGDICSNLLINQITILLCGKKAQVSGSLYNLYHILAIIFHLLEAYFHIKMSAVFYMVIMLE